jgi:hypothetical protein
MEVVSSSETRLRWKELCYFEMPLRYRLYTSENPWRCRKYAPTEYAADYEWGSCSITLGLRVLGDNPEDRNESSNIYNGLRLVQGVSKRAYDDIPNITVWWVLRKRLNLKAYKLFIDQGVEGCIVGTSLIVNVFVTLATQ